MYSLVEINILGEEYIAGVAWEEVEIDELSSENRTQNNNNDKKGKNL